MSKKYDRKKKREKLRRLKDEVRLSMGITRVVKKIAAPPRKKISLRIIRYACSRR